MKKYVALDFECSGLDYYNPTFKVVSCSFSWRDESGKIKNEFVEGFKQVEAYLQALSTKDVYILVHNLSYELGVLTYQFPQIKFNLDNFYCTKRLTQVSDGGMVLHKVGKQGLSLEACTSRYLPTEYHDHKQKFYTWLREHKDVKSGDEGRHLLELPRDLLKEYNTLDTDITLLLYEELIRRIKADGYNKFELDHILYRFRCKQLVIAEGTGVKVDLEELQTSIDETRRQIEEIETNFFDAVRSEIDQVLVNKTALYLTEELKTDRGYRARLDKVERGEWKPEFKIASKDLYHLYHTVMGIEVPFWTRPDKDGNGGGNPSFKKQHLSSWHKSGKILEKRGTLNIALKQMESLYELSKGDGRWHISMNATGTKTGRLSGGKGE